MRILRHGANAQVDLWFGISVDDLCWCGDLEVKRLLLCCVLLGLNVKIAS
jgi:hypothetical protein